VSAGERSGTGVNETQTEPQPFGPRVGAVEVVSRGYRGGLGWHEPTTQEHRRAIEQPACLASPLQALPSLSVRKACPADRRHRTCRVGADECCARRADLRSQIIWICAASVTVGQLRCAATRSPHQHPRQAGSSRAAPAGCPALAGGGVGYVRDVRLHPGGPGAGPGADRRAAAATAILCLI
jgi:hypothetical protein